MGCNPKLCPERPYSKHEDESQEHISQMPPEYAAVSHVQMQVQNCKCTDASMPLMQKWNLEYCTIIVQFFIFLKMLKQEVK